MSCFKLQANTRKQACIELSTMLRSQIKRPNDTRYVVVDFMGSYIIED